ncbi:MAG: DUF2892 domain-containing protein [Nitrospira sp.]|nr:DUF2892 domain-containing protein [Nitrospira sp.]MBH0198961.1 DUF2892 domain-containing protein [Nitrospira sp.]
MICNVGGFEKPIRIVGGLLLIGVGAFGGLSGVGMGVALTLGVVFLATGVIGYCPLTSLLGINTCHSTSGGKK